nr:hypothetical protein [Tanacetum cinerariifolium]
MFEAFNIVHMTNSVGFKGLYGITTAQLVLLVYKVDVVFNKVNDAKSRVTTAVRVSTARWIKWLKDQDMRAKELKIYSLGSTSGIRASVEQTYEPTSVKEKLDRKNEMKARGTMLMALPNKDQLKFHSYQDVKLLMEAIEKRLQKLISQLEIQGEVIEQEDINLKRLRRLPFEWKTHALIWRIKAEIETISLDDLYNNLKIYEPELIGSSSTSQNPQNVAFVSSNSTNSTSSTNEADNTTYGVSTTHTQECRAPENQENRGREYGRKTVPVENPTENVLIAQDGFGGAVKTVESVDVKNKGTYSTVEIKLVKKNNFSPPIIED